MLLEVGRIVKAHGIRGEVLVDLVTDRHERVAPGATLTTKDGRALVVLRSSAHQGKWIVAFDGIADRSTAESMRNTLLHAESIEDPSALWVHELIGSSVRDARGTALGTVASVEANPASDLLVLDNGGLIPLRFVVASAPGALTVELPEGLLEEAE